MSVTIYYAGNRVFAISHTVWTLCFVAFFVGSLLVLTCCAPRGRLALHGSSDIESADEHTTGRRGTRTEKSRSPPRTRASELARPDALV